MTVDTSPEQQFRLRELREPDAIMRDIAAHVRARPVWSDDKPTTPAQIAAYQRTEDGFISELDYRLRNGPQPTTLQEAEKQLMSLRQIFHGEGPDEVPFMASGRLYRATSIERYLLTDEQAQEAREDFPDSEEWQTRIALSEAVKKRLEARNAPPDMYPQRSTTEQGGELSRPFFDLPDLPHPGAAAAPAVAAEVQQGIVPPVVVPEATARTSTPPPPPSVRVGDPQAGPGYEQSAAGTVPTTAASLSERLRREGRTHGQVARLGLGLLAGAALHGMDRLSGGRFERVRQRVAPTVGHVATMMAADLQVAANVLGTGLESAIDWSRDNSDDLMGRLQDRWRDRHRTSAQLPDRVWDLDAQLIGLARRVGPPMRRAYNGLLDRRVDLVARAGEIRDRLAQRAPVRQSADIINRVRDAARRSQSGVRLVGRREWRRAGSRYPSPSHRR